MKKNILKRLLSLALALVMVMGMVPHMTVEAHTAASEANTIGKSENGTHAYTSGLTVYYKYNNYLYKAVFSNIKNLSNTGLRLQGESLLLSGERGLYLRKAAGSTATLTLSDLPATAGKSVSGYLSSGSKYALQSNTSVVTITCMAVNPAWSWNGFSATAEFTSTDGNAKITVNASVVTSTTPAADCQNTAVTTYTAKATCNGQTYTDTKTAPGEKGPHSLTYSANGNVLTETCANCSHSATATLNTSDAVYTGSAIANATVSYGEGWKGTDKPGNDSITYTNNTDAGTATASITVEGKTLTKSFTINSATLMNITAEGYTGSYDGHPHGITVSATGVDGKSATVKYGTVEGTYDLDASPVITNAGDTPITVYYQVTKPNHTPVTGSQTITISPYPISGEKVTVEFDPTSGTYNGQKQEPTYTVKFNGNPMTENDYTTSWGIGDFTSAGDYKLVLNGQGNFSVSREVTYNIAKTTPDKDDFSIELPQNAIYDDETAYSATVSVKDSVNGMGDVTVKYNGSTTPPTDAGTYTVTVDVAAGDNYNAATIELGIFTIAKANGEASVTVADHEYGDTLTPVPVSSTNGTENVTYQYKIKGADDSTYIDAVPTLPGDYTVKASFPATANYKEETATADFTISKRQVTVKATDASKTYGDADPELAWSVTSGSVVSGEELAIVIDRADGENAGDYTVTASQTEGANKNYDITFVNGTFTISKAALTIAAENKTATYGDKALQYTVTGSGFKNGESLENLGGTLAIACDYAQFSDKGEYTITPSGYESGNYEITYVPGTLTVGSKAITVTIADKTSVYGEAIAELTANTDGIVNNDTNVYSLATDASSTANVGTYPITGTALDANYTITFEDGTYTITKALAVATAPTAVSGLVYNTAPQTLIATGSTNDGNIVYSLDKDGEYKAELPQATAAGTYYVWYKVIGDGNHNDSAPADLEVKIDKADPGIGAVTAGVVNDTLATSAIVLTRANTDIPGTLTVDAEQTLVLGENTIRYTFTPNDTANYKVVTGEVAVTVVDTIVPTGTVTVSTKSWAEFLNDITFGLFFKETQTVSVTADDNLSGVAKIEYIESKTAMNLDAVKAATQWTEMKNGSVSVTLEDAKQFIYYIRITDKSGNVAFLSSDGAEYDTTAPVIAGVDNGVTYYTTQNITVTDKNIDTITLNGETATGSISLAGNKEATYTIVATDKAGNSTTVTVKMAPISDITAPVDGKSEANVTSDDKTNLQTIVDTVTELLKDEDMTAEEKAALEKAKDDAEALIEVIEDTANTQKAVTDKEAEYDEDAVKSTDKAELEELAEDIDALLDTENLTQDEQAALETLLEQVEDMIDTINATAADKKAATDTVDSYDPATVTSSDKAAIESALDTIEDLLDTKHLTGAERDALEDAKAEAEALLDAIDEATKAADTDNTAKVEDVTADNVTPEDKSDLEKAKDDLEDALEKNGGNYTEEEKKAIEDEIKRIEDALETLENVEAIEDAISDLPATVEPDDEETVAKIEEAKKAYDELTDYEKSLVDEKVKEKLDKLTAAAVAYDIVKGDGGKWSKGTTSGLSFTVNGPISKFISVEIDGKVIDVKYYSAKAGSTIITLNASYLETLATGEHTITVVYSDGEAEGTFKVNAKSVTPATGDDSNIMLWGGAMVISLAALVVLLAESKKRRYVK